MIILNVKQLRDALDYANPDGPEATDQLDTEISIDFFPERISVEGKPMPAGFYAWLTEYPDEGVYGPLGDNP